MYYVIPFIICMAMLYTIFSVHNDYEKMKERE